MARGGIRLVKSMSELAERYGWRMVPAHDGYIPDWSSLRYNDGSSIEFTREPPDRIPSTAVLEVPNGRVAGHDGWAIARGNVLIGDATFIAESARYREFERLGPAATERRLPGATLTLASAFSSANYGHALLDSIGRLAIVERAGIDLSTIDHVIVPGFRAPTIDRILRTVGIPERKIVRLGPREHVIAERLLVTSFPGLASSYPTWLAPWFRKTLEATPAPSHRLFVGRAGGHRNLANPSDLASVLAAHAFVNYDPTAPGSGAEDFAAAKAIAGPHGAALSDIVFCEPGTPVVEILPSGHRFAYFATLAAASGLDYVAVRGASLSSERNADFTVDPDEFALALQRIGPKNPET